MLGQDVACSELQMDSTLKSRMLEDPQQKSIEISLQRSMRHLSAIAKGV